MKYNVIRNFAITKSRVDKSGEETEPVWIRVGNAEQFDCKPVFVVILESKLLLLVLEVSNTLVGTSRNNRLNSLKGLELFYRIEVLMQLNPLHIISLVSKMSFCSKLIVLSISEDDRYMPCVEEKLPF